MVDFDAKAATWDLEPRHTRRSIEVADAIRKAIPLRPRMTGIEIGAGTGLLSRALAADLASIDVTDASEAMVTTAAAALTAGRFDHLRAHLFDVEHGPLPSGQYDLVFSQLALHHMADIPGVIARLFHLVSPGGAVALVDLDHDPSGEFHSGMHGFHGHHGFHREEISQWLADAGFADIAIVTVRGADPAAENHHDRSGLFLATAVRSPAASNSATCA